MRYREIISENANLRETLRGFVDDIALKTGATVDAEYLPSENVISLNGLERGRERGSGAAGLQMLVDFADQHHLPIHLTVLNGVPGLIRFYMRFGFRLVHMDADQFAEYEREWDDKLMNDDDFLPAEQPGVAMAREPGAVSREN